MNTKLRIKVGDVEVEYEGDEQFLKQELAQLLNSVAGVRPAVGQTGTVPPGKERPPHKGGGGDTGLTLTTKSIAARLDAKSGNDLLLAAAAHLVLVKHIEPFSRAQLLEAMKSAHSYYNKNYSANLTGYIKRAIQKDGPLSETASDSYALTAHARKSLEQKLADA